MPRVFSDRAEAGRRLTDRLATMNLDRPVVYALPRGGVPVAAEIAARLGAPLDLLMVRKLGFPGEPEVALGAVLDGAAPQVVFNPGAEAAVRRHAGHLKATAQEALREIERRRERYLGGRSAVDPQYRTAVVVDDGLATGATARVAVSALKKRGAARVIVAAPVGPARVVASLAGEAEVVCLEAPQAFEHVGAFYRDFHQLTDDEVVAILSREPQAVASAGEPARSPGDCGSPAIPSKTRRGALSGPLPPQSPVGAIHGLPRRRGRGQLAASRRDPWRRTTISCCGSSARGRTCA